MKMILGESIGESCDYTISTENDTLMHEWCCDCGLRHVILYDPVQVNGKLRLRKRLWRDSLATKLLKHYKRSKGKQNLKGKKK